VGGSSLQNTALSLAVIDLESGEESDTGNRSEYPAVIAAIEDIERLPITSVTPAESAEFKSDGSLVDGFFSVGQSGPSCGPDASTATKMAAALWFTEPQNATSGVAVDPLKTAVEDLQSAETEDPSGTACYPAAIDDLVSLESATPADIAASAAPGGNHANTSFGAEIGYLNQFFLNFGPSGEGPQPSLSEPCPSC
jgi:hypothetical protein